MFVNMLPQLAKAVAEPLGKMERMVVVSTGPDGSAQGTGAARVTRDVTTLMAQLPPVVEALSGVSLKDLVARIPGLNPSNSIDGAAAPAVAAKPGKSKNEAQG
jgi:flotillin